MLTGKQLDLPCTVSNSGKFDLYRCDIFYVGDEFVLVPLVDAGQLLSFSAAVTERTLHARDCHC